MAGKGLCNFCNGKSFPCPCPKVFMQDKLLCLVWPQSTAQKVKTPESWAWLINTNKNTYVTFTCLLPLPPKRLRLHGPDLIPTDIPADSPTAFNQSCKRAPDDFPFPPLFLHPVSPAGQRQRWWLPSRRSDSSGSCSRRRCCQKRFASSFWRRLWWKPPRGGGP